MRDGLFREIAPVLIEAGAEVAKEALCRYFQVRSLRPPSRLSSRSLDNHVHLAYCHLSRVKESEPGDATAHLARARGEVRAALSASREAHAADSLQSQLRDLDRKLSAAVVTGQDLQEVADQLWRLGST